MNRGPPPSDYRRGGGSHDSFGRGGAPNRAPPNRRGYSEPTFHARNDSRYGAPDYPPPVSHYSRKRSLEDGELAEDGEVTSSQQMRPMKRARSDEPRNHHHQHQQQQQQQQQHQQHTNSKKKKKKSVQYV